MNLGRPQNLGQRGGLKLSFDGRKTLKESRSVRIIEWKPNVVFPMLPKLIFEVDETADLLEQFPSARNQESLDAAFRYVPGAEADILFTMIDPVDLGIPLSAQNQVLLIVVWSDGMHELADSAMLGIKSVYSILLFCGLNGMLDNPVRQATLSNLCDEMPVRLVMRAVSPVFRLVRPMPDGPTAGALSDKGLLTDRAHRIRIVGVVVIPNSFSKVVVDHGIIFCSNASDHGPAPEKKTQHGN